MTVTAQSDEVRDFGVAEPLHKASRNEPAAIRAKKNTPLTAALPTALS
jgi:hypothetical protein